MALRKKSPNTIATAKDVTLDTSESPSWMADVFTRCRKVGWHCSRRQEQGVSTEGGQRTLGTIVMLTVIGRVLTPAHRIEHLTVQQVLDPQKTFATLIEFGPKTQTVKTLIFALLLCLSVGGE